MPKHPAAHRAPRPTGDRRRRTAARGRYAQGDRAARLPRLHRPAGTPRLARRRCSGRRPTPIAPARPCAARSRRSSRRSTHASSRSVGIPSRCRAPESGSTSTSCATSSRRPRATATRRTRPARAVSSRSSRPPRSTVARSSPASASATAPHSTTGSSSQATRCSESSPPCSTVSPVPSLRRGNPTQAIACARRRLALDPLHEPAHRQLIGLLAEVGDRQAAMEQYRDCVRVLDRELGVRPLDETTVLYHAIVEGSSTAPSPPAAVARKRSATDSPYDLVGRDAELSELFETLRQPRRRRTHRRPRG